ALQHTGLNRGTDRYHLVGVDAAVRFLAVGEPLYQLLDGRHPGRATDQDDLVEVARPELRVLESAVERLDALVGEVCRQLLELGPGDLHVQVLGAVLVGGDEGQVDVRFGTAGELRSEERRVGEGGRGGGVRGRRRSGTE